FQAEDGIRDFHVTGVQTCALPICCKAMLVEAEAAQEVIERNRSEPRGIVRVSCPVTLVETQVAQMVADFMVRHPQVEIHLEATRSEERRVGKAWSAQVAS